MAKLDISINIINIIFTLLNTIISIILQVIKNSFISETKSSLFRYNYFLYVLLGPYFKLLMTALCFDIFIYLASFLLKKYFFKLSKENQQNVLTKSVQENMTSNILVEFFFMLMIKGLALGFGIFYLLSSKDEIEKIKGIKDINQEQEQILNKMKTIIIIGLISNCSTCGYQLIFYGIRIYKSFNKKNLNIKNKID